MHGGDAPRFYGDSAGVGVADDVGEVPWGSEPSVPTRGMESRFRKMWYPQDW
jgi:hypothetical protein